MNPESDRFRRYREALLDPQKGYIVVKGLYSNEEVQAYRRHCEELATCLPRLDKRINTSNSRDYIHYRSHDRFHRTRRIYQFHHNHIDDYEGRFFHRALAFREGIESGWDHCKAYRRKRETLLNFSIATHYQPGFGRLARHKDSFSDHKYPLLQSLLLLSSHSVDYRGGDFILYTAGGKAVSIQSDLELAVGDLLCFDKSLEHEVTTTYAPELVGNGPGRHVGRWSLLIGVRAMLHSYRQLVWRRIIGSPLLQPFRSSTF